LRMVSVRGYLRCHDPACSLAVRFFNSLAAI
jgi:hypothetical protein